jgi:hypothetical protein
VEINDPELICQSDVDTAAGKSVSTDLLTIALLGKQMADIIGWTTGLHSTDGYKPGAIGLNDRSRFKTYGIR